MDRTQKTTSIFRCPACLTSFTPGGWPPLGCRRCNLAVPVEEGVPVLLPDRATVDRLINEARKAGRGAWYEEPQITQWQGPYRHHLQKRKAYVESVLDSYARQAGGQLLGLDLGCGDGANLTWLTKYFSTLYASDYNLLRLIRAARVPGTGGVFMADVTHLPLVDQALDAVFFNHVLEHIPDDNKALAEVYRVLKPGGIVVLGVPNEGAWFWQLAYRLDPQSLATSDHVHFYTAASLRSKCLQAGFVVREVHALGWGVPHWRLDSLIRRFKWVDDLLEKVGRAVVPSQATSLYLILSK